MLGSYEDQDNFSIFILYRKQLLKLKRTSLRPLFPQKLHAWQAPPAASASRLSGSPARIMSPSCCTSRACLPRPRYVRRYRWWRSSWWTCLFCWFLCLGGPASGPCKCTTSKTQCASCFSFHRPSWVPWRHSWRESSPSKRFGWALTVQAGRAFWICCRFVSGKGSHTART